MLWWGMLLIFLGTQLKVHEGPGIVFIPCGQTFLWLFFLPTVSIKVCSGKVPVFLFHLLRYPLRSLINRTAPYGGSKLKECEINDSLV